MERVAAWLKARGWTEHGIRQSTNGAYDVDRIRADFPILAMQVYGKPLVYLDNAASAQKPQAVLDRLQQAYTTAIRQRASRAALPRQRGDRGLRGRARKGARRSSMPGARKRSSSPATPPRRSISSPIRSAASASSAGDEIVLSIMEHHSNIVPWHFLRERQGAVIKWAPVDDEGNFLLDEFEKLLTPRTKMVAITHMSNMLGTLVPVKEVSRIAHARGIPVLVDGAQGAVHLDVDVQRHRLRFLCLHRPQALRPDRHRRALRQIRASRRHAAVQRRRRDDPRSVRRTASPMAIRRTNSRPARRRSCRRSGSARRSTMSARSARRASAPTRRACALRPRPAARDQFAAHFRHGQGQGADRLVRDEGRASARRRDHHRPRPASRCAPAPIASCRCSRALA